MAQSPPNLQLTRLLATFGGIGLLPGLPGTAGSAAGLLLAWLLSSHPALQAAGCAAITLLGFWSAEATEREMKLKDPSCVVIDEVAGMMIGVALLPVNWKIYAAGFLLFRFFDILKPWPIRRLERLPGGVGIMLDDLAAGAATHLTLQLALRVLGA